MARPSREVAQMARKHTHSRRRFVTGSVGLGLVAGTLGLPQMVGAEQAKIRFVWWGPKVKTNSTLAAIDVLKQKLPDIKVDPTYATFNGYFDKLATQAAGGGAPDIFGMLDYEMREYSSRNALLDLSQYVPKTLNFNGWEQGLSGAGSIDGKVYGVPPGVNAFCYYYDKTQLDALKIEMPGNQWTWDDFKRVTTSISKAGGGNYYGAEDMGGDNNHFEVFVRQRKKQFFGQNGLGFEKQDLIDWWNFWGELRDAKAIVPFDVQSASTQFETSPFFKAKAAMRSGFPDQYVSAQALTKHDIRIAALPNGPAGSIPGLYVRPSQLLSGFSKSKSPESVALFIEHFVNDADVVKKLGITWGFPSNPTIRAGMQKSASPVEQRGYEYMQYVTKNSSPPPPPPPQGANQVQAEFGRQYGEVGFGKTKVTDAVDHFFTAVKDMLK